jgi:chromosome segregation ATPase
VKFREQNALRPLNHQTQSGGERSVSTMLYLMALQELCPVPFRCVDEINQGMDPANERRVFDMMVKLLSSNSNLAKTQYFLLTPKLLNGLTYNDRVTVHIIHNSPSLLRTDRWDPLRLTANPTTSATTADESDEEQEDDDEEMT